MSHQKGAPIVSRALLIPFIVITSLFALWGFANDVTNPMVSAFKTVMPELSWFQAYLVQFAFYFGYGCMAIPAALFIRKYSYKAGIILGLVLYATGAFLFYPASSMENYTFFLLSLYIITCGLSFLETTANPLILSLGARETATQRLNLAQAFNPIGSLSGMLIAQFVVLSALQSDDKRTDGNLMYETLSDTAKATIRTSDLEIISYPYLGIGVVVLIVLAIVMATKIPKLQEEIKISFKESISKIFAKKAFLPGVLTQMTYIGAQIMCWTAIYQYVQYLNESRLEDAQLNATYWNMTAMIIFLVGRFAGTAFMTKIKASKLLFYYGIMSVLCCLGAILIPGIPGLVSLVCISFFMSINFPTIYGIALKDMDGEAKVGSAFLVMAIVGGAIFPPIQGLIIDIGGPDLADTLIMGIPEVKFSFIMPMLCLIPVIYYGYSNSKSVS